MHVSTAFSTVGEHFCKKSSINNEKRLKTEIAQRFVYEKTHFSVNAIAKISNLL